MSEYRRTVQKLAEQAPQITARTDYRCAAYGCPNAGSMDDTGPGTGTCYHHWREPDRLKWDAITHRIRSKFDAMRNFGELSDELKAKHRAEAHKRLNRAREGNATEAEITEALRVTGDIV